MHDIDYDPEEESMKLFQYTVNFCGNRMGGIVMMVNKTPNQCEIRLFDQESKEIEKLKQDTWVKWEEYDVMEDNPSKIVRKINFQTIKSPVSGNVRGSIYFENISVESRSDFIMEAFATSPKMFIDEFIKNNNLFNEIKFIHLLKKTNYDAESYTSRLSSSDYESKSVNIDQNTFCSFVKSCPSLFFEKLFFESHNFDKSAKEQLKKEFSHILNYGFLEKLTKSLLEQKQFMSNKDNEALFYEMIVHSAKRFPDKKKELGEISPSLKNFLHQESEIDFIEHKKSHVEVIKIVLNTTSLHHSLCMQGFSIQDVKTTISKIESYILTNEKIGKNWEEPPEITFDSIYNTANIFLRFKPDSKINSHDIEKLFFSFVQKIKEQDLNPKDIESYEKVKILSSNVLMEYFLPEKEDLQTRKLKI